MALKFRVELVWEDEKDNGLVDLSDRATAA